MVLPSPNYWFDSSAWVALSPTVLTGVLGVIALPAGLSTHYFGGLIFFALLASFIVWWNAAKQAERADQDRQIMNRLLAQISVQGDQPTPPSVEDIRHLSAHQLRSRVADISQRMRRIEHAFQASQARLIYDRNSQTDWDAHTNRLIALSSEQARQWRAEVQPEAVALWREMQRRIYCAPPYPEDRRAAVALEHGMLAGVAPLSEAALALEDLARQLD